MKITRTAAVALLGVLILLPFANANADSGATYISPSEIKPEGSAKHVQEKLIKSSAEGKTYMLVLRAGDEVYTALNEFATRHQVAGGRFTALGAVKGVKVGWLDLSRKKYKIINIDEQVEIVSLLGDIGVAAGKPAIHGHVVVSRSDGSTRGGHLIHAITSPTVEVIIDTYPTPLPKSPDEQSGMTLFNFIKN